VPAGTDKQRDYSGSRKDAKGAVGQGLKSLAEEKCPQALTSRDYSGSRKDAKGAVGQGLKSLAEVEKCPQALTSRETTAAHIKAQRGLS